MEADPFHRTATTTTARKRCVSYPYFSLGERMYSHGRSVTSVELVPLTAYTIRGRRFLVSGWTNQSHLTASPVPQSDVIGWRVLLNRIHVTKKRLLVYSQNESSLHYITNDLIPAIPAISRASKVETAPVAFLSLPERKLLLLTDSTLTYDVALAQKSCHEECRRIFTLSARSMSPLLLAPPDWSMFSKVCSDR